MVSKETCIELLEQFILDEDRIITFKVLSQELDMHVNIAKQYLTDFFKIQKSKNVPLQVTYFLAGVAESNGMKTMKVLVISEDKLEEMKKLLDVTSCHIYSISKAKVDKCSLSAAEKECNENGELNKYFSIKHPRIETKPTVLKKVNVMKNETKTSTPNQVSNSAKNGILKNEDKSKTEAKGCDDIKTEKAIEERIEPEKKDSEKSKAAPKGQKSNPLTSMWQKKDEKSKDSKSENGKLEAKGKNKSPGTSKSGTTAKNNIMSMFSKQAAKNSENPKKEIAKPLENKKETKTVKPEEKVKDVPKDIQNCKKNKKQIPDKTTGSKRKSSGLSKKLKLKQDSDSDEESLQPNKKKRKRICTFDDSESESENEEAQDRAQRSLLDSETPMESSEKKPSPMELTDDEEPIPPTPQNNLKGRKRIWKTVQKTFKDEDGFLITKQQKELVSASESDDENPLPSKSNEITKQNSVKKQSSLTNFFKKS